jgi:hypothetical protein
MSLNPFLCYETGRAKATADTCINICERPKNMERHKQIHEQENVLEASPMMQQRKSVEASVRK